MSDDGPPVWVEAYCDQLVTHLKKDLHNALEHAPLEDEDHSPTVRMFMTQHDISHRHARHMARGWDLAIAAMTIWITDTIRDDHEHHG